jgi:hypothetical protein
MSAVGIAWFRKEDFPALMAMFEDGPLFDSFEQWERRAEKIERELQRDDYIVERVYIDPDAFPNGAEKKWLALIARVAGKFAAEVVEKKYGCNQS